MAIPKILLYYVFTPLADPDAVRLWQRDLCESLGIRGRILVSTQGLNGTIGGDLAALKRYVRKTRDYPAFTRIEFKWSNGTALDEAGLSLDFPRLVVKVRDEIVSFGAPDELRVNADGVVGGGEKLSPLELHALVGERGDDVVFFDGRNAFEAEIGRFRNAVVPDVSQTREFVAELDSGRYDHLKGKPVVTYCTGGIRCEVLSGLMKDRGFMEVYQLDGGVVRYGEAFGDDGLWDGSLYVFDQRMSVDFSDHTAVLGRCQACGDPTKNMLNCRDASCREQLVVCEACAAACAPACSGHARP
ncbi:rhodanese-related sulfurtransferase [Cryobacterium algoritolerans]|uniref:tRNA uridine(34) hydroxylase n=1 Tax=Cryobacterium algoritolerans TaxID=1259184 RepID=A0A4R8WXN9_9MICO|nr:rhodanese-related sulfurtransferase [Cryobacterium algoritolerans]TFC16659.1 rhodanese-related sulfurtransferase [Cryobacterium algoritolerans]